MKKDWKEWCKKIGREKIILLVAAGIILILSSVPFRSTGQKKESVREADTQEIQEISQETYIKNMEEKLKNLLEQMDGVGQVHVMIQLEGSETKNVLRDETVSSENSRESDSQGGERTVESYQKSSSTVSLGDGSGQESPYILSTDCPKIGGVAVIAEGAGNIEVKEKIIQVIKALFGIEINKIMVTV